MLIVLSAILGYWIGISSLSSSPTTTTTTPVSGNTTTVTMTVLQTVTSGSSSNATEARLTFLGDNQLFIKSEGSPGTAIEKVYHYKRFPYSDFSFRGLDFTYSQGKCEEGVSGSQQQQQGIEMLPCGSHLQVKFPTYGWHDLTITRVKSPTATLINQDDDIQWYEIHTAVVDGKIEDAGLLLVVSKYDGSRTLYVTTGQ